MGLIEILIGTGLNAAARLGLRGKAREWYLFLASLLAVFLLQPELPVRGLDFWLPMLTIGLAVLGWSVTAGASQLNLKDNQITAAAAAAVVLILAGSQFLGLDHFILPSLPPPIEQVLVLVLLLGAWVWVLSRLKSIPAQLLWLGIALILLIFVVLKTPWITQQASILVRSLISQGTVRASALDIRWLGFSYIAFRLIHTLRDRQAGRLPEASLREYMVYLVFFPAISAGPIDRLERFVKDYRDPVLSSEDWAAAGQRIVVGLFKKFLLADSLAVFAINSTNFAQVHPGGWAWVFLYAYALQIYLDFSGYTDVAIGMARLVGIHLPENFKAPLGAVSLTSFWNQWHITLTQWIRGYVFNPLVRAMRRSRIQYPAALILLVSQLCTMVLIGLWHGISWNFLIWGAWHGLGLFFQNRWSEWIGLKAGFLEENRLLKKLAQAGSWLLTFHYVALGWVWFALPEPAQSMRFLGALIGR